MNRILQPTIFCLTILPLILFWSGSILILPTETNDILKYTLLLPLAYILGSIPWGYIFLQWSHGIDIRNHGSGKTGMSNVLRTGGRKVAALVLILDISKGILIVLLARDFIGTTAADILSGLLALIGHNWPIFLKFRGGRGIATGLGGLSIMAPIAALCAAIAFIPVTLASKYVSLGSISGTTLSLGSLMILSVMELWGHELAYLFFVIPVSLLILLGHISNFHRLTTGIE